MDLDKVPAHTRAGLIAMNADKPLAHLGNPPEVAQHIIKQYLDGASVEHVARSYGVSTERLYTVLVGHAEEDWKAAQAAKALKKLDDAEVRLETAADGVTVSREREVARLQMWKLERVLRRIYGQDSPQVQVNINLGNVGERIADLERELLSQRTVDGKSSPTIANSTQVIDPA